MIERFTNGSFLLAIAQVVVMVRAVLIFGREMLTPHVSPGVLFAEVSILAAEMVIFGCFVALTIATTVVMFMQKRLFRFLFAAQWLCALAICAADFLIMFKVWTWQLEAVVGPPAPITGPIRITKIYVRHHLLEDSIGSFFGILVFGGLLLGYVLLSKRVRTTFSK